MIMKALNRFIFTLIMAACLVSTTVPARSSKLSARGLFVSGEADALRVLILKNENGNLVPVDPSRTFIAGDKIKIKLWSNFDGYVYVINIKPGGEKRILFPNSNLNLANNKLHANSN